MSMAVRPYNPVSATVMVRKILGHAPVVIFVPAANSRVKSPMPVNDQGLPGKSRAITYPLWWVGLTLRVKGNNISRIWVAVVAFALDMVC